MRIKVFQIDEMLDRNCTAFQSYDSVIKLAGRVDPSIYKTVYDGNVEADDLEAIYMLCNTEHPVSYNGHSMSVGDVIELQGDGCFFCDSFGFKRLADFDSSKTTPIEGHRMLVLEPHKEPYEMVIPDHLDALQQAVGGLIECTYPFEDNAFVIGNEEAKLIGLEGNRRIGNSIYAGTVLIAADDGYGGTKHLTDEQITRYTEMFKVPDDITPEEVQGDIWFRIIGFDNL